MSETVSVKLQAVGDVEKRGEGWVYTAIAQFYERVNDRLMVFTYGSGAKTIRERVPTGRVKIHSGHPWDPNASTIVGKVLEARESREDGGVWYRGFLSSAEEAVATKLLEGVVDENSLELFVIREDDREVSIDAVPEHVRRWIRVEPNGMTKVREIREWRWDAIGLVSSSSQGRRALLDPPTLIPLEDLPLASSSRSWDHEEAAARVAAWAGDGDRGRARIAGAYLARRRGDPAAFLGLVADVVDGRLAVVPEAVDAARAEVADLVESDPETAVALARQLGRIEERLTAASAAAYHSTTADTGEDAGPEGGADAAPAQQEAPRGGAEPDGPEETSTALQPTAGPGATPPTETAGSNGAPRPSRDQRLRELRASAVSLGIATLPDQEVGDDAQDRPGADAPR